MVLGTVALAAVPVKGLLRAAMEIHLLFLRRKVTMVVEVFGLVLAVAVGLQAPVQVRTLIVVRTLIQVTVVRVLLQHFPALRSLMLVAVVAAIHKAQRSDMPAPAVLVVAGTG